LLKDEFPDKVLWHCLNHRLEHAVGNALNATSGTMTCSLFLKVYILYIASHRRTCKNSGCAHDLRIGLKKNRKCVYYSLGGFIFQSGIRSKAFFSSLSPTFSERFKKWN